MPHNLGEKEWYEMVSKKGVVRNMQIDGGKLQWIAHKEHSYAAKRIALIAAHLG